MLAQTRVVTSVIPSLAYGPACTSAINLQNLSERAVTADIEGHRESGALVALAGLPGTTLHLAPNEHGSYKLDIDEETTAAWAKVREQIPSPDLPPALAVT